MQLLGVLTQSGPRFLVPKNGELSAHDGIRQLAEGRPGADIGGTEIGRPGDLEPPSQ